jgi:HAMP domain-containing protein
MIVNCEECGKRYRLDPLLIKGNNATAICRNCKHIIPILKSKPVKKKIVDFMTLKRKRFGLRPKIFLLFFLVPIVLFGGSGFLFIDQLNKLSAVISEKSSNVVTTLAESIISQKAYAVAREVTRYLKNHPTLTQENFFYDKEFMEVAVQKVGKTGYTVVNSAPTKNEPWKIRAHPRKDLIGSEILGAIKARLNERDFIRFKKLHDTAFNTNQITVGYYRFLDGKEKYMAMVPVKGTNYWVLSTTYIDEFTLPMQALKKEANLITYSTVRIVIINLMVAILLVAFISFIYGLKLVNSIRVLTDVTNRFSVGEMNASINLKAKDEIGDLAEAITRMQESIRWAFKRSNSRRNSQPGK